MHKVLVCECYFAVFSQPEEVCFEQLSGILALIKGVRHFA